MMKICYVVTIPLTIRSFFLPQLYFLANNGFDVTVVCSEDEEIKRELGSLINYIPISIPRGISIKGSIKAIGELKRLFKAEQFDLIQYSTPNAALYASIAAKKVGCKVRNYHLMGLRYLGAAGVGRVILKSVERITCNNSTSIECVSKSNMMLGIQEGLFSQTKATIVWNGSTGGVDLKRFDINNRTMWRNQIRNELNFSDSDFVFGFIGRVTRDKGVNELLSAIKSLKSFAKLIVLGPQEGLSTLDINLLNEAKQNTNILFFDVVTDVERFYAAIDVIVLPSYREGLGNVIIEAGAMGVPAIISDIPGLIDTVIPNETAFLVSPRNSIELANAMERMIKSDYKQMGIKAYNFVKSHFDSDILCEKIYERKKTLLS